MRRPSSIAFSKKHEACFSVVRLNWGADKLRAAQNMLRRLPHFDATKPAARFYRLFLETLKPPPRKNRAFAVSVTGCGSDRSICRLRIE
jgi:hypothetical protein